MSIQTRTTALQNEIVRLYATFEVNSRLTNPAGQPLVEIIDSDGVTVLKTMSAIQENTGIYYVDWYVPANLPVGNYYDRWTAQFSSQTSVNEQVFIFTVHSLDSYINFISRGPTQYISNRAIQLSNDLSNEFIYECMHIPIYWEAGIRVQQENQQKRVKQYYYFTLPELTETIYQDAVYFNNGQRFTVFQTLEYVQPDSSSSSESMENTSTSSSSSSSFDSTSSSSSSSSNSSESTSSSLSSESVGNVSSSTSSGPVTTTTTTYTEAITLTCVGTGTPSALGTLTKISGNGPATISYTGFSSQTSRFSTIYDFAYRHWNKDPRPLLRKNNTLIDDGWYADYDGRIYVDKLMAPEDNVSCAYNFAYFGPEEILSFLDLGLKMMNTVPPASMAYTSLDTMPAIWDAPVLLCAAITALKRLIFGLNFQEKRVIFGTPEDADRAMSKFQQLYQDYNTLWMEMKKDVKTNKLPNIAMYVTPEYTLPGGRSRWFRYMYKSG